MHDPDSIARATYGLLFYRFEKIVERLEILELLGNSDYRTQLISKIRRNLNSLKPVVAEIQLMKENPNIQPSLSIKEIVDFENVVSEGKTLCERFVSMRSAISLDQLGNDLGQQFEIFEGRRHSTSVRAWTMLSNSHDHIRKLIKVNQSYSLRRAAVLKQVSDRLYSLERVISNVEAIEMANRNLQLSIAVVDNLKSVLSNGGFIFSNHSTKDFHGKLLRWDGALKSQIEVVTALQQ